MEHDQNQIVGRIDRKAYTVAEVAEMYGLCKATVYNEARRGRIEIRKLGGRSMILTDELNRWASAAETFKSAAA